MKKLALMFSIVAFGFVLAACNPTTTAAPTTEAPTTVAPTTEAPTTEEQVLENAAKDYYATGQWNGWDTKVDGKMEAIKLSDPRVASIVDELEGVKYLYVLEGYLPSADAGWGVNYIIDGVNTTLNGNQTVKVIRTAAGDPDSRDWWAQSPESGQINNLTPDTLFMPEFVENATTSNVVGEGEEAVTYTSGAWNDNPAALEAGSYLIVFAEFNDNTKGLGLIPTSLVNEAKDYYATGQFNGWDTKPEGMMEAISINDPRVASIVEALEGVKFLYLLEATLPAEDAGWAVNYIIDGVNTTLNGNLTVKVIRTMAGDPDTRDWWAQSPESGQINNLTPDTLFVPEFVENATTSNVVGEGEEAVTFTSGAWNDNPAALQAGVYYIVFAEFNDNTKGLGLIWVSEIPTV
ncbi:MAG: hypothetical protein RBQ64_00900 [Candidatus Izemoplasmatales bacterium]|jgi:hypothetical protein|nr:hypothetical protein [Candidatus Izemoplasmatales bacterium]